MEMQPLSPDIRLVTADKKRYLPLLLLGDEQESMIDRYLERGDLYVLSAADGEALAVAVVTLEGEGVCELKNLAVNPRHWRRGLGRRMVENLCALYRATCHTMLVGTGDSPRTVGFYRSCGFVYSRLLHAPLRPSRRGRWTPAARHALLPAATADGNRRRRRKK